MTNIDWRIRITWVLKPPHRTCFSNERRILQKSWDVLPILEIKELFLGFNKINSRPWRKRHPSWWGLETWSNRDEVCAKLGHRQHIQQVQEHLLPITHAPYLSKLLSVHLLLASFIAISIPSCWRDRCHQPGCPPVGLRPRLGAPQRIQITGSRSIVQPQSLCAIRDLPVAPLVRVT